MSQQQAQPNNIKLQPDAFAQLASQVHATVNTTGSAFAPNQLHQQHSLSNSRQMMVDSNPMVTQIPATQSNLHPDLGIVVAAGANQQQQPMPYIWPVNQGVAGVVGAPTGAACGHPGTFPIPIAQLSMSSIPYSGMTPQEVSSLFQGLHAPVSTPVSNPSSVSTKDYEEEKPAPAQRRGRAKASGSGKTAKASKNMNAAAANGYENVNVGKTQQSRERNREHARSTRLRKKAYVQKLKDMAQGLRAVQTIEIRERSISMQKLLEIQKVRRAVVHSVLEHHASYERDPAKWNILLEENFWLKEPVSPFRSFRRSEVNGDCRIVRGTDALICDAASTAVMLERVGCYNARWKRIKRSDFVDEDILNKEIAFGLPPESSLSSESGTDSSSNSSLKSSTVAKRKEVPINDKTDKIKEPAGSPVNASSESSRERSVPSKNKPEGGSKSATASNEAADETPSSKRRRIGPPSQTVSSQSGYGFSLAHSISSASQQQQPLQALSSYNLKLANTQRTSASYYMNVDDMIMTDDVMMCPFVFRTRNAVVCGALRDCVVPGMLRTQFSANNKLLSMEMIYDAMGLMQQLDAANGGDITAQVIPGSLEMALTHCPHEARVVTEAKPPYSILHVNDEWARVTQHSQLEVEGQPLLLVLEGADLDAYSGAGVPRQLVHALDEVANGRPACSTSIHHKKFGKAFVDFMCSYPLTNEHDEISHMLHVTMELPNGGTYIPY